jgi:hypothetical protein
MKGKTKKIVLAVAVIGALAAGVAFTEANVVPDSVAGYDNTTITGATATAVNYTLSADGTDITDVVVTFSTDITGKHVRIGFNGGALGSDCTIAGTVGSQTATCSGLTQDTVAATALSVTVNDEGPLG